MSTSGRIFQVLDLLARKGPLGVRAVATQSGMPVASVHRLLNDLAAEDAVLRGEDGNWQLAYRLLSIVDTHLDGLKLPQLARPHCETIAGKTRESVNLNILSGDGCVCLDKVRGNQGMQLDWHVGSRGPLHCGGSAKAILAFLGEAEQDRLLAQPLQAFTRYTITNPDQLRVELARIRKRGYSVDSQEVVVGVFCIGVPIVDRLSRPVAAISISGPSPKAAGAAIAPQVELLQDAAETISKQLGYAGAWPPGQAAGRKFVVAAQH